MPGGDADARRQRGADQRQRRLPAPRAAQLLHSRARAGRRAAGAAHRSTTTALLGKVDWTLNAEQQPVGRPTTSTTRSNENQTFDVATYGTSANGTEGDPSKINLAQRQPVHARCRATRLNEFHLTLLARDPAAHRRRPRTFRADTGIGFAPSFRFGNPFFLRPNVDELVWRFQIKDNLTIVSRRAHHQGRRRVAAHEQRPGVPRLLRGPLPVRQRHRIPALRLAGGARRLRPVHGRLLERRVRHGAGGLSGGRDDQRRAAAASICRAAALTASRATRPARRDINNEELSLFVQDKWQPGRGLTLDYGLRWDAQLMPETVDPKTTAFAPFLNDPRVPVRRHHSRTSGSSSSRASASRGTSAADGKSVLRGSAGIYYARQNMLSQVGSVTTNGIQQKSDFRSAPSRPASPTCRCGRTCCRPTPLPRRARSRCSAASACSTATTRIRASSAFNVGYERELAADVAGYVDFTWPKGAHLTRFLNYNVHGTALLRRSRRRGDTTTYTGANPFEPQLGDVFVTNSRGSARYRGATLRRAQALRRSGYQLEANYVLAKDEDDDSNERDPFTDRTFNFYDLEPDYGPSDRDIRHKVNFFSYVELPQRLAVQRADAGRGGAADHDLAARAERRDRGRNWDRKDNAYFSLDWRLQRPFRLGGRYEITPSLRDVQHVQQRQQHQPADDAGAVQLRRLPAPGRRRSAPGAAGREGDVLRWKEGGRMPSSACWMADGRWRRGERSGRMTSAVVLLRSSSRGYQRSATH